jgi:hypothetical protein
VSASIAPVGVLRISPLSLRVQISLSYLVISWSLPYDSPVVKLKMQMWRVVEWWRHRASRPHWAPGLTSNHWPSNRPIIILWAYCTLLFTCSLQVSRESRTVTRYLNDIERCKLIPKKTSSEIPFLVNTISVLSELADKPTSPQPTSTVWQAYRMSPDTVFGNFPTAKRQMSSA